MRPPDPLRARTTLEPAGRKSPARTRRLIAHLALVNGALAWVGVVGLVGGGLSFGDELDDRLPWGSLTFAGVALAAIVAIPLTVLARLAYVADRRTATAAILVGVALVGWIAVQIAVLRAFSWFQPTYTCIGLWFVALGMHLRTSRADP